MDDIKDVLISFAENPGLCPSDKLDIVQSFRDDLIEKLEIYVHVFGKFPLGLTLDSRLASVDWYKEMKILRDKRS